MPFQRKRHNAYHHGDLATALLSALEELATKFGLEAVSLRACAKAVGVSPAAAFKHYADKRSLLTAFAAKSLQDKAQAMHAAREQAGGAGAEAFLAVGLAYVAFALQNPAKFQLMWRRDLINERDPAFQAAYQDMRALLASGFADTLNDDDPETLDPAELLAWSSVHGLASLMVEGSVGRNLTFDAKMARAETMLRGGHHLPWGPHCPVSTARHKTEE